MDEIPKTTKNSVKEVSKVSTQNNLSFFFPIEYLFSSLQERQLVTACIFPGGRNTSSSEKVCGVNNFLHYFFLTILLTVLIEGQGSIENGDI
jgi:hypothetical protein